MEGQAKEDCKFQKSKNCKLWISMPYVAIFDCSVLL